MRKIGPGILTVVALLTIWNLAIAEDRQWVGDGDNSNWDFFVKGNPLDPAGSDSGYLNWDADSSSSRSLPGEFDHLRFSGSFDSGRVIPMNSNRLVGSVTIDTPGAFTLGVGEALGLNNGLLEDNTGVSNPLAEYSHLVRAGVYMQPTQSTVAVTGEGTLTLFGGLFGQDVTKTGTGILELGTSSDPLNPIGATSVLHTLKVTAGAVNFGNVQITEENAFGLTLPSATPDGPEFNAVVRGTLTANRVVGALPGSFPAMLQVAAGGNLMTGALEGRLNLDVAVGGTATVQAVANTIIEISGTANLGGLNSDTRTFLNGGGTLRLIGPSLPGAEIDVGGASGSPTVIDMNGQQLSQAKLVIDGSFSSNPGGLTIQNGMYSGTIDTLLSHLNVVDAQVEANLAPVVNLVLEFSTFRAVQSEATNTLVIINGAGTLEVPSAAGTLSITAVNGFPGAYLLSKTGGGRFELANNGSFNGTLDVTDGTAVLAATNGSQSQISQVLVRSGATFRIAQELGIVSTSQISVSAPPIYPPSSVQPGRFEFTGSQTLAALNVDGGVVASIAPAEVSLNAPLNLSSAGGTFEVAAGGVLSLAGPIANSFGGITKTGPGTLVLPGVNNAAGAMIVRGGTVRVGNDLGFGPVPSVPLSGAIQLDHGGLAFPGSFRIGGNRGIILNSGGGSFEVPNFQAVAVDGKLEGPGTLTKTGAGTLILSGAYNSTGGMDVQQGVLQIKEGASAAQTIIAGHVSVAPGATMTQAGSTKFTDRADIDGGVFAGSQTAEFAGVLAGAGSLNSFGAGQILVTGQLSPGHSVGHLFAGGTVSLAGDYYAEIGGTNAADYDQLIVNGTANLGGSLSVVLLNDFQPHFGDVFQLVSATNFSGNFSAENLPSLANGLTWDISQLGSTGSLSVVPEPTTLALLLCAAPLAARRLRRAVSEQA